MKKIGKLLVLVLVIAAACGGFYLYHQKTQLSGEALTARLENASDLTTQKMVMTGVVEAKKGSIPIIAEDKYLVRYKATVTAGFDISKAKARSSGEKIIVTIPHAEIQNVNISSDDVRFYNTNFSIIRADKNSLADAVGLAEKDARKTAKSSGILDAADRNGANVVKGLYSDLTDPGNVEVRYQ